MLELQSIFCFFYIRLMVSFVHPIHVSVTEIEMDEKDKRLEIMMRVFTDDLELTLRASHESTGTGFPKFIGKRPR